MAYQYVVTAQKPTAVTKCITGNFTSPNERNLLLAKNTKIEVYTIVAEGLRPAKEIPIFGKITVMKLFRPNEDSNLDYLFILTDRYHGSILYCKQNGDKKLEVITKASGDLSDPVGRPPDSGIIGIIDPCSKLIGLRLYEGVIKFLPYDIAGEELRPFNVKVEQLNMIDAQFLHGSKEPEIALIFQNTQGRHVHTLRIDQHNKEVKAGPWGKDNVDSEAQILISVPEPVCGVLIIGQSSITYQSPMPKADRDHITIALPDDKNTVTCYAPIDNDCSRVILGNQAGKLYMLMLVTKEENGKKVVDDLEIVYLGETSIPEAMCYLDNGVVYIGSRLGDSQLIKFLDPEAAAASGGSQGSMIKVLENFPNIGPIVDMCVVDLDRQGQNQLVTCSGAFKDGSLRVIRNGIGIHDHASFDLKTVKGMWPLRVGWGPESSGGRNDCLIISSITHTRVLKFYGEEVEEKDLCGYDSESVTLHTANVCHDQMVQITDKEVRLIDYSCKDASGKSTLVTWKPNEAATHITVAAGNFRQLLIACGSQLHYFEIGKHELRCARTKQMEFDVACLSIDPLREHTAADDDDAEGNEEESMDTGDAPSPPPSAKLCAVGLWKDNTARIYRVPTLEELHCDVLSADIIPRSIALVDLEGIRYCLSSLGDGNLVYYQLNPVTGALSDKKTIQLTTSPTVLRVFALQGGPTTVFACSDRPSVIYSSNKKLVISNVNLKRVNHMCVLDSDGFQNSLAIANEETVVLGTIDAIQKLHIRKVELNECPRRIAHQEETRTFGVSTTRTDLIENGRVVLKRPCASSRAKRITKDPNTHVKYEAKQSEVEVDHLLIFDEISWEVLHAYQLGASEQALSVMSCSLGEDTSTSYYVLGTAFVHAEETEPRNGRIIVFRFHPTDNMLEVVHEKAVKGAVYSLCAIKGNVLASINNTVSIYKWLSDENQLRSECNRQGNVMALYLKSRNDFVLVGDLMRSLSVLNYKHVEGSLEEVARDYNPNWMTAVEIIDDETFIGAENFHNIIVCQKQLGADIEPDSVRLNEVGSFHVGDFINSFRHGTLVMKNVVDTELKTKENSILFGTVAGSIGVVTGLEEDAYHFLLELQKKLSKTMASVGNIQHESWRSFCTVRKTEASRGFIDGDLIETFLDLPREDKQKIAQTLQINENSGKRTVTVDELIKKVEELSRLH